MTDLDKASRARSTGSDAIDPDVDLHLPAQRREVDALFLAAIAAGGVLGAEARYAIQETLQHPVDGFPWSTVLINTVGCLLIGALMAVLTEMSRPHRLVRPFFGVGMLGGFTTFSTASVDAVVLADAGRPALGACYVLLTVIAALAAVTSSAQAVRALIRRRPVIGARR